MIFPDYHLHSQFSSDSKEIIENIITTAKSKGMNSICLTDHYDMDFPVEVMESPEMDFNLDIESYYKHVSAISAKESDIDVKIGIELGVMESTTDKLTAYVDNHAELDFIISSIHVVDNMDPYYPIYFEGKTEKQGYDRYFELLLSCAKKFKSFNVLGHLDYILRYGPNKADNFKIADYCDLFKELFSIIVPDGKGIEINTGSLYKNLDFPHPHPDILKLYKEAGGEIITIGSDAHKAEYIGYGFNVARDLLLANGFKYYCTFDKQKPTFNPII